MPRKYIQRFTDRQGITTPATSYSHNDPGKVTRARELRGAPPYPEGTTP